ncbi:type IV pilus modification protein PilV [uncultured Oxalicibacterium sp.]|uniref:type IV pilus modification protein PilV n=1 Tax=uncultured Oxalicibacterium sp. TaxID=1168540 RepID=UPI0025F80FE7|nr:type IV pilus modification protein PilV [uncultured Oxalicibacterium sp.]
MKVSASEGFSLIEVLVAIFVLSVGILAASGLYLTALQTAQHSKMQTQATHLAVEIAEVIRMLSPSERTRISSRETCKDDTTACNMQVGASVELAALLQRVPRDLPGGQVVLCRDDTPWDTGRASLRWECASDTSTHLLPFVVKIGWHQKDRRAADEGAPRIALQIATVQ